MGADVTPGPGYPCHAVNDRKDIVLRRIVAPLAAMVVLFVASAPTAQAAAIDIPVDTVVMAGEGSITVLATIDTPSDLIGSSCVGVAEAVNQPSVHQGNDLIVASGDDTIVLRDVEREPGAVTRGEALLALGPKVSVSLRMGPDEVYSGGLVFTIGECTPPPTTTTEPPPTTTEPTTTSTQAPLPAIVIEKLADPEMYGDDGVGHFTIRVTNPGPVDLTNVYVTDDIALAVDPASDCPNSDLPDLAVDEYHEYTCTVANLDGVSPFTNEATAVGTGPDGTEVTDTDDAVVLPQVSATTITQPPPTTAPPPTLPVTGVPFEQVRGTSVAGLVFLVSGIGMLYIAALIGHARVQQTGAVVGLNDVWLTIETRPRVHTFYLALRASDHDPESEIT